ncbi:MAG: tetratricopeptide repeat protein [Acidobacteria bacterium]|nr:tetratricopeptide repeat protein [Acidobacteriota bacterium]
MTPAVGMRFGRYELLRRLGAGGMGEVYRARDYDLDRDVALKFLPERFASDPDRLDRFATEARVTSSLNHPNIVTIHEIGHDAGASFIVMELVEGRTLREVMRGTTLGTRRVLDLAVQAADGLARAHAAGIVHRDLKPENLMVTGDGLLKILDFGLVKLRAPDQHDAHATAVGDTSTAAESTHSGPGLVVGTAGYMSPEQAAGHPVDFRSDQFALGTILYEMITGRRAFKRDTPVQTISAVIESDPEPLGTLNDTFPAPGRWIVERCLAKDPAGRYASTADLANDLRAVRDHLSEVSTASARERPRSMSRRAWLPGVGVLASLLVVLVLLPSVRERLSGPWWQLPLPAEKRIAVLPFRATATVEEDDRLCDGLAEYLVARLGQLERFQRSAWVVPSVEVRQAGVTTADSARRALGATLVVTGSLQRVDDRFVVTANIIDATSLRQVRAATFDVVPGQTSLLERTVEAVIEMLDLEIGPDASAVLHAGVTGVVEASTLYAQALGLTPYKQARTALERHDHEQNLERAIDLFSRALEQDPRYALAHAGLGEAYWRLSRFTKKPEHVALAEQHCRRALEVDPLVAQAWVTLGIVHNGTGKPQEALEDLQRALDRNPRHADAHRELANAYGRLGQDEEAVAMYRRAITLGPDFWVNYHQFGTYLVTHGQPREAEDAFRSALALVPDNARVWSGLGAAYYYQSKYDDAKNAWQKSLELFPTASAASNLGTRQFLEGRYAEAAETFERALAIDDRDYRVWRNLAAARAWVAGGKDRARAAFARAAELAELERTLDPLSAEIHADLADCYANLDKPREARAAAAEAARLGTDQAAVASSLAETYEHLGNRSAALEWIEKALALGYPVDPIERAPGLATLRADPRYRALIDRLESVRRHDENK